MSQIKVLDQSELNTEQPALTELYEATVELL